MTFEEFLTAPERNAWVSFNHARLYVRKNLLWKGQIDLANMTSDQPGSGDLRAFLNRYQNSFPIYVENVLNPRLADFFRTLGWHEIAREWVPCFLNDLSVAQREIQRSS